MPTIKTALAEAIKQLHTTTDSPALDAEILLGKVLEKDRSYLRTWPERELTDRQHYLFCNLIQQRSRGEPVAYLTGTREFWSREFLVTPDVLIPRPDTELLIELSLGLTPADQPWQILDLGTGSGIIAITIACERPLTTVRAVDISPAALKVAKANAKQHKINNITFIESDWFANIPESKFDLIISNPPYIAAADPHLMEGDLRFEPKTALTSGERGLEDIEHLALMSRHWLNKEGYLLLEHGYNQKFEVQALFKTCGYQNIKTLVDLSGQPRVSYGRYLPQP